MANLGYGGRGNAFQGFGSTGDRSIPGREPTDGEVDLAGSKPLDMHTGRPSQLPRVYTLG